MKEKTRQLLNIFIASGLLGIFITSITNLYISYKSLSLQTKVEEYKVSLEFHKEKLDILREIRPTVAYTSLEDPRLIAEKIKNKKDVKALGEYLIKWKEEYDSARKTYEKFAYLFSKDKREKLNSLNNEVKAKQNQLSRYFFNQEKKDLDDPQKSSEALLETLYAVISMGNFQSSLIDAIDEEIISTADKLSNVIKFN